ncbi:MAG: ABC-type branched-subunit amino acid transport system substrate-binding protein, partial [Gammaproteobacteria bacterium]
GDETIAKVLDFGISKPLGEEDLKHTQLGMVMGTPGYLAPEQINGQQQIGPATDVYALGAMLHYMITGKKPYSGASAPAIMNKQLQGPPELLTESDVSDPKTLQLQTVITKAMTVDVEKRYATAKEFWHDILVFTGNIDDSTIIKPLSKLGSDFQFVFGGKIKSDTDQTSVALLLKENFSITETQIPVLFSGKRIVIRKQLTEAQAQNIAKKFAATGALGIVELMPISDDIVGTQEVVNSSLRTLPKAGSAEPILLTSFANGDSVGQPQPSGFQTSSQYSFNQSLSHKTSNSILGSKVTAGQSDNRGLKMGLLGIAMVAIVTISTWFYLPARYALIDSLYTLTTGEPDVRGVTANTLTVGMSAAFSGGAREIGRSMRIGIEAYFKQVNDRGGIHGRSILLTALNDGYEPQKALKNIEQFVGNDQPVMAMIGNVGTPTAKAILPQARKHKLLLLGTFSGASLLRNDPPDRYVFNYRASYAEETSAIIHHYIHEKKIAPEDIAVFYQNDSFGLGTLQAIKETLYEYEVSQSEIVTSSYERNTVRVDEAVSDMSKQMEQIKAVIVVGTYAASAAFTKGMREVGYAGEISNISFVGSRALAELFQELDPALGEGILITQVVPMYDSYASGVLNYREALTQYYPNEKPDFISLEGYIVANIFANALERVGRNFNNEDIVSALESINDFDLGIGTKISFSLSNHQASHKVWGTMLNKDGSFSSIKLQTKI